MILKKFEDISIPTLEIWDRLNYMNIDAKNKLNYIISNKKLIHNFDDDIDSIILYSLNYYDNLNLFVIFGKDKNNGYKYYSENYANDYSLYGIKHLRIKSSMILKIMYQLLFARMIIKTKDELNEYLKEHYSFIHEYNREFMDITILFLCKKELDKKYPNEDVITDNFCVYIPNTKETIWNCACVFFCNGTLNFLEKQNFDYFLKKDFKPSKKMFLKYRKWLNSNIDNKYQFQFILFSSVVLYLLGHRLANDIDLYIHTSPTEVIEKINELTINKDYSFIEYKLKNSENWPDYWDEWLDKWAQKCGAKYFEEILANSKYHFYFLGVKIISLDCDIVRRLERNRPRAVADLIALRKRYQYRIDIPPIPDKLTKYISTVDKTEREINELINQGGILNEKNKEVIVLYDSDINKFIGTIIYALELRYKMIFTVDQIKKELNMYSEERVHNKVKIIVKKNKI